jgi:hypothetical protein
LEYVIVLIAIVACIAWMAIRYIGEPTQSASPKGVGKIMQQTGEVMKTATGNIAGIK